MISESFQKMNMPVSIRIDSDQRSVASKAVSSIEALLDSTDRQLSPFRSDSDLADYSKTGRTTADIRELHWLCQRVAEQTKGFFDPYWKGQWDPTGITKSWAIAKAGSILKNSGFRRWVINVGGDILARSDSEPWKVGIEDARNPEKLLTIVDMKNGALATSGFYARGEHVKSLSKDLLSVSVLGESIIWADAYATALLAAGETQAKSLIPTLKDYSFLLLNTKGELKAFDADM